MGNRAIGNRAIGVRAAGACVVSVVLAGLAACAGGSRPAGLPASPSTRSSATTSAPADSGSSTPAQSAPGAATWTTFGHDNGRHGVDPGVTVIRSVRRRWRSTSLDGAVYGQPLVVGTVAVVATEADSVYAFALANGGLRWHTNLGSPVPGNDLPCGDIDPSGITSTPVIDAAANTAWVVAFLQPAHHELVALDLVTGAVRARRAIDPPGADPRVEQQRGALLLAGGRVYVPYGGLFGDCGNYHGWIVSARTDGTGDLTSWQVPSGRAAGIWATGGPVADGAGDLFTTTGNSESATAFDFGNTVVRVSPALQVLDWFAPVNWATLNAHDGDLGSTSPALVGPAGAEVLQIGKSGVGYLLEAGNLGHLAAVPFSARVCGAAFGATAYVDPVLFVPCTDGLRAVRVGPGLAFHVQWKGPAGQPGPPIVAGGAVWYLDTGSGELVGLDPATGQARFRVAAGDVVHFASPAAGAGFLVVAAGGRVEAFGSA
jgi:outer membrane protein assembly factor BamB